MYYKHYIIVCIVYYYYTYNVLFIIINLADNDKNFQKFRPIIDNWNNTDGVMIYIVVYQ